MLRLESGEQEARISAGAYDLRRLREDIWLGLKRGGAAEGGSLFLDSDKPAFVLCFSLPRAGKGSGGGLPSGVFTVKRRGAHALSGSNGRGLVLCITVARLRAILQEDVRSLPAKVKSFLAGRGGRGEAAPVPLTPEQILAGNALLTCPYEGAVLNMYMKSKVLELVALFFGQMSGQERGREGGRLFHAERGPMTAAREHLLAHMENPPNIRQLARHAGVNDTKLKRLFKDAYGLSPYAYLRAERMAAAREMIVSNAANVSEAALSVGYSNVSHFIAAFVKQYGVRPGELRRRHGSVTESALAE